MYILDTCGAHIWLSARWGALGTFCHTPFNYEDPHSNVRRTSMEMVAFRGVETTFIPKMGRLD